jgi:hypothetical protein
MSERDAREDKKARTRSWVQVDETAVTCTQRQTDLNSCQDK